jgi:hypothetical protein
VIGIVVVAALVAGVLLLLARRRRAQAARAWRERSAPAVDVAGQAIGLLPMPGQPPLDAARWQSVRQTVDRAAEGLDRTASTAPTEEGVQAGRRAAEALRGLVFAVEADQLLRGGPTPPSPGQLADSDAVCRARRADAASALQALERLVKPLEGNPQ